MADTNTSPTSTSDVITAVGTGGNATYTFCFLLQDITIKTKQTDFTL